jgi:16S rRNA (uracil1498-N3)-methyltransferase
MSEAKGAGEGAGGLPRFLIAELRDGVRAVDLPPAEVKHARVRRLRNGAAVMVFDGKGTSYRGRIESYSRDAVRVALLERCPALAAESPLALTLAVAVLKADRLDWVIEKTTELGVGRILPFQCEHSLAQPSAARQKRWQSIAAGAAKQSGRSVVPVVAACTSFAAVIARLPAPCVLFWEGEAAAARLGGADDAAAPPRALLAIVGPEGGFTAAEAAAARAGGARVASLGPRILRADTAAIAAVALCQHLYGDI